MRKFISLLSVASLVWSFNLRADHMTEYFTAVLKSEAMKEALGPSEDGWLIKSIAKTATFRCIGCFGFTVVMEKYGKDNKLESKAKHFSTSLDWQTEIISVQAK